MFLKIAKIFIIFALCALAALWQASFISALSGVGRQINLGLMIAVFSLFFFGLKNALAFSVVFGFLLDLFSFQFFGFHVICLAAAAWLAGLILKNWLTNRSLYSLWAILLASSLAYNILLALLVFAAAGFSGGIAFKDGFFWRNIVYQFLWSFLAASLFFSAFVSFAKRYQPFILEKKNGL